MLGISFEDMTSDEAKKQTIDLIKDGENINIYYEKTIGENIELISFEKSQKTQGNDYNKNMVIKYENSDNKIEIIFKQENKIVDEFENKIDLNEENSMVINNLEEQQLKKISDKVKTRVKEKIDSILEEDIKEEDILKILENIMGVEENNIMVNGITETEKNRFNAQFELLKADGVEKDGVIRTIDIIKNNLIGIKIESNSILKLELDKNNYNEDIAEKITKYIEKMKDNKYNISIEYDDETGLAKYVVLTIVVEQ